MQSELKLRLIKLNWQKSMCTRVKSTDEQAKSDVKVWKPDCSHADFAYIQMTQNCWLCNLLWIYGLWGSSDAESQTFMSRQLKKQALKEKIEEDVGALVQFLLDEKDDLLERLEAEAVATIGLIDANLKRVESEAAKVDKAITEIQNHLSDSANFEVKNFNSSCIIK